MAIPVRLRLALVAAALIVTIEAAIGAFVYLRLEADLRAAVDDGLVERAQALVAEPPTSPALAPLSTDVGDIFAAVLTRADKVVASTPDIDSTALLDAPTLATLDGPRFFERTIPTDEDPQVVRVLAMPSATGQIVVTGVAFDDQRATLDTLGEELAVALPIAALLALLAGWLVGQAALRPVERMRIEAEAISESGLDRRLSVPPTRDELASLAGSLNRMLERVETAVERERRVVDDASHELRTPLANLKAELDLALRRGRSEAELVAALRSAGDETDRLVRLAADLLVLARAHGGQLPIRPVDTDVSRLVGESRDGFAGRAAAAGIRLETAVEPRLRARLDEARVRQALDNVVDNAIRHTPRGGTVTIDASRLGGLLRLAVADTGPGFRGTFVDRAFDPFTRADEARTRPDGGAGLGLAIVRAVAEAHGGTALAANRLEGGAIVEIRIPA
jgi:two-component system, OmpR family, sensor kinase